MQEEIFRIVHHDREAIRAEVRRLQSQVGKLTQCGSVRLVGSSAVAGVIGKGDLDFALGVAAEDFAEARAQLDEALARDDLQFSSDQFQAYHLPSEFEATLQLFVYEGDQYGFDRFVSLLQSDADLRSAYNALKREWDGKPMEDYRQAKSAFIEKAISR